MTKQEKAQAKRDRKAQRDNSFATVQPRREVGHINNSKGAVMRRMMAEWLRIMEQQKLQQQQNNGGAQ